MPTPTRSGSQRPPQPVTHARLTTLLLPGIGTIDDLERAHDLGVRSVRVATHCTEGDIAAQHIATARELGMDVSGFLMMSHMAPPDELAAQAKLMESYGAHCVYVTDSGGRLTMTRRPRPHPRLPRRARPSHRDRHPRAPEPRRWRWPTPSSRSRTALTRVDASLAGHGRRRRQLPDRAVHRRRQPQGWKHGCDLFALKDAADDLVRPLQDRPVQVDRETLTLGYAGVYSSFLRHAEKAAATYGLDTRDILLEVGRRRPGRRPGGHDRRRRPRSGSPTGCRDDRLTVHGEGAEPSEGGAAPGAMDER